MADALRKGSQSSPYSPKRSEQIRAAVESLLKGPLFAGAPRRGALLRYLVERTLAGQGDQVNEYSIGLDVLQKSPDFDPRIDSAVRTEVTRLRQRMRAYYDAEGLHDTVHFEIPPRSYRIIASFHEPQPVETMPAPRRRLPVAAIAGVVILLAAVAVAAVATVRSRQSSAVESLVVLPFEDLSPNHDSGYLADGLTDELTNDLANINGLRVIARTSAFQFKDKRPDIHKIGEQLHVEGVLDGSLARDASGRIRIRAQFSRVSDGYALWSRTYDLEARDLLTVQERIARSIASDLQLSRTPVRATLTGRGVTTNEEAHDLYLRGTQASNTATPAAYQQAAAFFSAAIAKDPKFARAWLSMAKVHWNIALWTGFTQDAVTRIDEETRKALALDPGLAEAHAILGHIAWNYDYNWPRAEAEFRLAMSGSGQANAHNLYGICLAQRGRFADAHQQFRMAEELSPLEFAAFFNEAQAYEWERRGADAERLYKQLLTMHPGLTPPLARLAYLEAFEHDCPAAADYAGQLARVSPNSYRARAVLWTVDVCQGHLDRAREAAANDFRSTSPFERAAGYAYLGDADTAIHYLGIAVDQHAIGVTSLKVEPFLTSLHSDPRFVALEHKLGLDTP